jgi:hypothetical protein
MRLDVIGLRLHADYKNHQQNKYQTIRKLLFHACLLRRLMPPEYTGYEKEEALTGYKNS